MDLKKLLTKKITRENLDCFIKKHTTNKKTLDLGCGTSPYSKYFPNRVGMDLKKSQDINLVGDAHRLPFKEEIFDIVLATEVLEHLKNPQIAINEMGRVLKHNGKLIITTRFIFPLHDTPNDYYRYTKYGLKHLLRKWNVVEIKEETDTMGAVSVLFQRIAIQCDILHFKLMNFFFHIIAQLMKHFSFIIKGEYGAKNLPESNIMTSGYYVIAFKEKNVSKN